MNGGMTLQRVVVTGMGTVNPLGHSVAETVATMDAGKVGIQPITKFDAEKTGITVAGEVKDFKPEERMSKRLSKRMDLFTQYGLYSAIEAYEQSGLTEDAVDSDRVGVIFGSGDWWFDNHSGTSDEDVCKRPGSRESAVRAGSHQ